MEYNTQRSQIVIPEYGRNIHKMIEHAISSEDRNERNHIARTIVKVMGQVKPQFKEADDFIQSLWDHMIIISDFKLKPICTHFDPLQRLQSLDHLAREYCKGSTGLLQHIAKVSKVESACKGGTGLLQACL